MCRVAAGRTKGFRPIAVNELLVDGENSLHVLAARNADGVGFVWKDTNGSWHEMRSEQSAQDTDQFEEEVRTAEGQAQAFVAHVRDATEGATCPENVHPFRFDTWSFIHNGTIADFPKHRAKLLSLIDPEFRKQIRGSTDSEHAFYFFLTHLKSVSSNWREATAEESARAMKKTVEALGRLTFKKGEDPTATNFVATSEDVLVAVRYNRQLVAAETTGPAQRKLSLENGTKVSGLVIASEPPARHLNWTEVPEGTVLAVDSEPRSPLVSHTLAMGKTLPLGMSDLAAAAQGWTAED